MANVSQKTLNWLYDVLKREYHDPNRTYSDLAHTLSRYPNFAPRTDVYTFENGVPALLVHLTGTIPVSFRGTTYRFPIALWIPHSYPYDAPMIYILAAENMVVRPGQHVGGDGKVYHHYLAHWRDAWDRSSIIEFLSILAEIFAKEPPVIAKPQISQRLDHIRSPPPPPLPPLPSHSQDVRSVLSSRQSQNDAAPPPPPKEPARNSAIPSSPVQPKPGRYDAPPPLPPQQSPSVRPTSGFKQQTYGNGHVQRPSSSQQYPPQRNSSLRQSIPQQHWQDTNTQQVPQYTAVPVQNVQPQQIQTNQPPIPQSNQIQNYIQPNPRSYPPGQQQQIPQYHPQPIQSQQQPPRQTKPPPPPDLLDSPFDIVLPSSSTSNPNIPAPPIPRNPEKDALLSHLSQTITANLHNQINQTTSALPALQSQHQAMTNTLSTLQSEIESISSLNSTLQSNINLLQSSLSQSDKTISSARHRSQRGDIPKIDEMLVAPTVVSKQLYDTVCEEKGIEAGIWALHDGFVGGKIGAEVWARRTRELAREGFRKRYLTQKIATGMGLDMD